VSLTTLLFAFLVIVILGLIFGVLKKNKIITWISLAVCVLLIIFVLFLIFVLIPAM